MSVFSREVVVRFEHCDAAGLMFYPRFYALVNEMVEDWFAVLGRPFKQMHVDQKKGVPTVKIDAEFLQSRARRIGTVRADGDGERNDIANGKRHLLGHPQLGRRAAPEEIGRRGREYRHIGPECLHLVRDLRQ